ncbi:MAG: PDZ domain-containing protein [Planctomycetota bacterium]
MSGAISETLGQDFKRRSRVVLVLGTALSLGLMASVAVAEDVDGSDAAATSQPPTLHRDADGRRYYQDADGTRFYERVEPQSHSWGITGGTVISPDELWRSLNESLGGMLGSPKGRRGLAPMPPAYALPPAQRLGPGYGMGWRMSPSVDDRLMLGIGIRDAEEGVLVDAVNVGSVADQAGLQPGDVILDVAGTQIEDANQLRNLISSDLSGATIVITVKRDEGNIELNATFPELPEKQSVEIKRLDITGDEGAIRDQPESIASLQSQIDQLQQDIAQLKQAIKEQTK